MNYKLKDRMALFKYLSEKKWACRKNGEIYKAERDQTYQQLLKQHTSSNGCKGLPNQFVPYVNILTTICPLCPGHICSGHHLKRSHNMNIQTPEEIIRMAAQLVAERKTKKSKPTPSRESIFEKMKKVCLTNIVKVKNFLQR